MNVLLHICCAPCSVTCIDTLRAEGHAVTGLWYNPNIHPYTEYKARHEALQQYAAQIDLPLIEAGQYGLREFVAAVCGDLDGRCGYCYHCRLEAAAKQAAARGLDGFTTTLLVSPYQNRDLLLQTGRALADAYQVKFLPYDFRPRFREGQKTARELGLYMQKYCGCIFSEEERWAGNRK